MNNNMVQYLIKRARKTKETPHVYGGFKYGYLWGGCAILKRREDFEQGGLKGYVPSKKGYEKMKAAVNECRQQGAQIPEMYANKYYFNRRVHEQENDYPCNYTEVQERVPGNPIFKMDILDDLRNGLVFHNFSEMFDDNPFKDAPQEMEKYIMEHLEVLSDAPQEHYNGLINTLTLVKKYGLDIDFINPANFLYDEKTGFWVVDIDQWDEEPEPNITKLPQKMGQKFYNSVSDKINYYSALDGPEKYNPLFASIQEKITVAQKVCASQLEKPTNGLLKK